MIYENPKRMIFLQTDWRTWLGAVSTVRHQSVVLGCRGPGQSAYI